MTKIEIHEGHAIRKGNVLTLALAGTVDEDHAYLILSLDEVPDEQDVKLGLVGVHTEWNDQAHGGYGMIQSADWDGADLAITITAVGQELGIPATILLQKAASHLRSDYRTIADIILAHV